MGSTAGRIALGVVGAVGGTLIGVGPAIGFAAGTLIGGLAFPPEGQNIATEGPRLQDLVVNTSTYGAPRPFGFGSVRVSGNIIWTTGIQEKQATATTSSGGGKGGAPSNTQTATTYTYNASWAMAFGEGPADDIIRIWADGKLIFDRTTDTNVITRVQGFNFSFYPGNETQLPDARIEEDKGVGRTPAFRGTAYAVFDDIPLNNFGNRIPNITAELVYSANPVKPVRNADLITIAEGGIFDNVQSTFIPIDFDRGFAYLMDNALAPRGLRRINLFSMAEDRQMLDTDVVSVVTGGFELSSQWGILTYSGDLVLNGPISNSSFVALIDGNSLKEKGRFGAISGSTTTSSTSFVSCREGVAVGLYDLEGLQNFAVVFTVIGNDVGVLRVEGDTLVHTWNSAEGFAVNPWSPDNFKGICRGVIGQGEGTAFFTVEPTATPPLTDPVSLYKITINAAAGSLGVNYGVDIDLVGQYTPTQMVGFSSYQEGGSGLVFDEIDGNVLFHAGSILADGSETHVIKINTTTGDIIWNSIVNCNMPNANTWKRSRVQDGTFGFVSTFDSWYEINTITGDIIGQSDDDDPLDNWPSDPAVGSLGAWDSRSESWIGITNTFFLTRFFFQRSSGNESNLSEAVQKICTRVGIDTGDLDTTELVNDVLPGYVVSRQLTARSAIQPLARLYQFDGVESGFKLKFVEQGKSPVRTITQDELVSTGNNSEFFTEQRTQEVELPQRFSITYLDKDQDYEQNTQSAKRIVSPLRSMNSSNDAGFSIAGSFDAEFIKRQAEKLLYTAWAERSTAEMQIPWTHLDLDPTDVINVTLDNGTSFRTRITEMNLAERFAIELTATAEEEGQHVSSSTLAFSGDGPLTQIIRQESQIRMLLLDSPLLRDAHEPGGRAFAPVYYFMGGYEDGQFGRGIVYKSADGVTFDEVGTIISEMTWGTFGTTLPDPIEGAEWHTDEVSTVQITAVTGADNLSSVTQLQTLNGANAIAVLKFNGEVEIIQARDIVQDTNFTFSLSGLLRGRRGTDTMAYDHSVGETWVLLTSATGDQFPLTLSEKGVQRTYRGVQNGALFENSPNQTLTSQLRGLVPYSVAHAKAEPDGNDIDFSWLRRARVGAGNLVNVTGTIPLAEDTEEYEIDIYDGPGGSIVRAVTGLTTPAYTYTSANQTTDGFSPPLSEITVQIFQISAQVGRGFSRELTLTII